MKSNNKISFPYIFLVFLLAWLVTSCSTTKYIPDGELLYTGIKKTTIETKEDSRHTQNTLSEIEAAIAYPPNGALMGSSSVKSPFPIGLYAYNAFVNKKGFFNKWMFKIFAKKPVLISTVNPKIRINVAQNLLKEYGFFDGEVTYEIIPDKKNDKKAAINYHIVTNDPHPIDSIEYTRFRFKADSLVRDTESERLIKKGDIFNVVQLEAERQRISTLFRNNGFYYFRPEYITYQADSTIVPGKVWVKAGMKEGVPIKAMRTWKVGDISVWLFGYNGEQPTDSVRYKDIMVHYDKKLRVRLPVIYNKIKLSKGDLYSQNQQTYTQSGMNQLNIFRYTEMSYQQADTAAFSRNDTLNLHINMTYDLPWDGEFEMNMKTKSNNQMGPGAIFSLNRRNLFGGGEVFSGSLHGSYEWQTGRSKEKINNYEVGVTTSLLFPKILVPWRIKPSNYAATTTLQLYITQLNRTKFFRMLSFGGGMTYDFHTSVRSKHSFTPFKLTYSKLTNKTKEYEEIALRNPALAKSLDDQFVPTIGYTYTYDNSFFNQNDHTTWWQLGFTQSGNIISAIYMLGGEKFNDQKTIFKNPFSQFVKVTAEVRNNWYIDRNQSIATRLGAGIIYSYGNSKIAPYSEQFYVGGANSIRAFTVRSVGPGRHAALVDDKYAYIDRIGDIKLEANVEYRFRLFGDLKGALFLDAGNVWLLRDDDKRPGGTLKMSKFLKDIALGTGAGLRYDLEFLVVRVDMGIALHMPYDTGKKGYYNIPKFKDGIGFHLAVGYPF